jgi:hypothetical protein
MFGINCESNATPKISNKRIGISMHEPVLLSNKNFFGTTRDQIKPLLLDE